MHLTLRWLEAHVFCTLSISACECWWQLAAPCRAAAVCRFSQRFAVAPASLVKWTPWVSTAWCVTPAQGARFRGSEASEETVVEVNAGLVAQNPREGGSVVYRLCALHC